MSLELSTCRYLFGKNPDEIFSPKRFSESFVNQCLDTLMRLHVFLFSKKDAFFLVNPVANNDQCHLYALRAALVKKEYGTKTEEEKLAKTEENQFLHLSVFMSFTFLLDSKLYGEMAEKNLKELGVELPAPKKNFLLFCKDPDGNRVRAARDAYNVLFQTHLTASLEDSKGLSVLCGELFTLSITEDLEIPSKRGEGVYYTFPKFAGVVYLVHSLITERLVCALKVKVMTNEGTGSFTFINGKPALDDPVLIFETFATDGSHSINDCLNLAKKCPTYHRRNPSSKQRHSEKGVCLFCNPKEIDLSPYKKRVEKASGSNPEAMFYALGADFIKECQLDFLKFFTDEKKYPELSKVFEEAVPQIDELGLSMYKPLTFSVAFVYTDNGAFALSGKMLMDRTYREHLKERGML